MNLTVIQKYSYSPCILVDKDTLLIYLLVSVPSILTNVGEDG